MALFFTSLASGSNGNCYYIGNEREAVLVDAGITCREVERRMERLGLQPQKLKAIFVSHEHSDHIRGLNLISKKYNLPVYITPETYRFCPVPVERHLVKNFVAFEPITVGQLVIKAFPKLHDASDAHSFVISGGGVTVGVFTDIGAPCKNVVQYFSQCHAAILESNFDDGMLDAGHYPIFLKNRIRGGKGHLSNRQALQLFQTHRPEFMSHLILGHLSKENNCPNLVGNMFAEHAGETHITVASRYNETPVYTITSSQPSFENFSSVQVAEPPRQMSLF